MSAQQTQTPPDSRRGAHGYRTHRCSPMEVATCNDGTRPQPPRRDARTVAVAGRLRPTPSCLLGSGQDLSRWQMTDGGGPVSGHRK